MLLVVLLCAVTAYGATKTDSSGMWTQKGKRVWILTTPSTAYKTKLNTQKTQVVKVLYRVCVKDATVDKVMFCSEPAELNDADIAKLKAAGKTVVK